MKIDGHKVIAGNKYTKRLIIDKDYNLPSNTTPNLTRKFGI